MFQKIRRASKQLSLSRRSTANSSNDQRHPQSHHSLAQIGFLGLPPELRNNIYEHVACDQVLLLPPAKPRRPPPTINLLLVCRQIRQEYEPLLYSLATFVVRVNGYDFRNLVRILDGLSAKQVEAFRNNAQLWIELLLSHVPTREHRTSLRGWLSWCNTQYTKSGACREIDWKYDVGWKHPIRPPKPASRYVNGHQMKQDLLRSHLRMLSHVETTEDDTPSELAFVREGIETYVKILENLQRAPGEGEAEQAGDDAGDGQAANGSIATTAG